MGASSSPAPPPPKMASYSSISSSPPVIPISNPQTTTTTDSSQQQQQQQTNVGPTPPPPPALRSFITHISTTVAGGFASRRPWSELVDRSAFSKPDSFSDVTLRIRKNSAYFRTNYLSLIAAVLAFSLITNPFSLFLLASLLAAWLFLYLFRPSDPPLVLFGRQFSERETLCGLIFSTVFVVFLTSVGSVLVSALMVGLAIVCTHAAFRAPDDLFLDDQDSSAAGFLSFFTGAAAAASAPPAVASRV